MSIASAWLFTNFMLVTGGISERLDGFLIDGALVTTAGLVATIFYAFLARFLRE